jgi:phosphopantetheinyl transferase (holo-ACP synthase)
LSGNAAEYLRKIGGKRVFVSISHEENYAVAMVTIEQ